MTPEEAYSTIDCNRSLIGNVELEDIIATSAEISFCYALVCLNRSRFVKGEPVILQSPREAMAYAGDIINGRWPEAEQIISTDASSTYMYARYTINKRFILGEENSLSTTNKFDELFLYITQVPNVDNEVLINRLIASPYGPLYKEWYLRGN